MSDFFESRVKNLDSKEEKKKSSPATKRSHKKSAKICTLEDSDSSVVESSEKSSVEHRPNRKYCILYGKCSRLMDNCKDLRVVINKHKQKKRGVSRSMENIIRHSML